MRLPLGLSLVFYVGSACSAPPAQSTQNQTESALNEAVALVEWQYPVHSALAPNPAQLELRQNPALEDAFFPGWAEPGEPPPEGEELPRYILHAEQVASAFVAGRTELVRPFLVNLFDGTPAAMRALIEKGVRVFSFSALIRDVESGDAALKQLAEDLETIALDNPEVLFFVSIAHIQSNDIPLAALDESLSRLAVSGDAANIILAGCIEYYLYHLNAQAMGKPLGTPSNPFVVDNQPVGNAQPFFMLNCASTRAFTPGFGGTSAAAPHLASLASMAIDALKQAGLEVSREAILARLSSVMHAASAVEKDGLVHDVRYFTLDTVRHNAGESLVTDQVWWGDVGEHPAPLSFAP